MTAPKPWHKRPGPMAGRQLAWLAAVSDYPGDLPPAWAGVLLGLLLLLVHLALLGHRLCLQVAGFLFWLLGSHQGHQSQS